MPKCTKVDCKNDATKALKLVFRNVADGPSVTAYIALIVCDEIHMPEEEVVQFYTENFETLCLCIEEVGKIKPNIALTRFSWVPLEEAETNWAEALDRAKTVNLVEEK